MPTSARIREPLPYWRDSPGVRYNADFGFIAPVRRVAISWNYIAFISCGAGWKDGRAGDARGAPG
jgi:hypothetical protein